MRPVYFDQTSPASINCVGGNWTREDPYWISLDRVDTEDKLRIFLVHIQDKWWWTTEHAQEFERLARLIAFPQPGLAGRPIASAAAEMAARGDLIATLVCECGYHEQVSDPNQGGEPCSCGSRREVVWELSSTSNSVRRDFVLKDE